MSTLSTSPATQTPKGSVAPKNGRIVSVHLGVEAERGLADENQGGYQATVFLPFKVRADLHQALASARSAGHSPMFVIPAKEKVLGDDSSEAVPERRFTVGPRDVERWVAEHVLMTASKGYPLFRRRPGQMELPQAVKAVVDGLAKIEPWSLVRNPHSVTWSQHRKQPQGYDVIEETPAEPVKGDLTEEPSVESSTELLAAST